MKNKIYAAAALIAFLAFQPPAARADGLFSFLFRGDPRVAASGIVVGAATTGAYFALAPRHHRHARNGFTKLGAAAATTVGCMVLSPMLAAAVVDIAEHRELTQREALGLSADCVIPFLGSWYWNAYFDRHPELERHRKRR